MPALDAGNASNGEEQRILDPKAPASARLSLESADELPLATVVGRREKHLENAAELFRRVRPDHRRVTCGRDERRVERAPPDRLRGRVARRNMDDRPCHFGSEPDDIGGAPGAARR